MFKKIKDLLVSMCKLFYNIYIEMSKRLYTYPDQPNMLNENLGTFKSNYSIVGIFTLHFLIELSKMYCAFIDF